jgi:hypothetical protein
VEGLRKVVPIPADPRLEVLNLLNLLKSKRRREKLRRP